ncbi:MAG: hypothetical protein AAF628_07845 [Planctomycetota bacterium]
MKNHCLFALLALAGSATAQGTLTTTTDYGVYAIAVAGQRQAVPAGTTVGPSGLGLRASETAFANSAGASTRVAFAPTAAVVGAGAISVAEQGDAFSISPPAVAGTIDGSGPAPHDLRWQTRAAPGTRARLAISWRASATTDAVTGTSIDVDGDGRPDFAHRVSGSRADENDTFSLVAGRQGFVIDISTFGSADLSGAGNARYDATLLINIQVGTTSCQFRPFGRECAGKLEGSEVGTRPRRALDLQLSGAAPSAVAALVIGDALPSPVPLPGSRCALLVFPTGVISGQTDPRGNASWQLGLPSLTGFLPVSITFQAVTLDLSAGGASLGSSNGLVVTCP